MTIDLKDAMEVGELIKNTRKAFPDYFDKILYGILDFREGDHKGARTLKDHPEVANMVQMVIDEALPKIGEVFIFAEKHKTRNNHGLLPMQIVFMVSFVLGMYYEYKALSDDQKESLKDCPPFLKEPFALVMLKALTIDLDKTQELIVASCDGLYESLKREMVKRIAIECGIDLRS